LLPSPSDFSSTTKGTKGGKPSHVAIAGEQFRIEEEEEEEEEIIADVP
jgi:hypothetical protein